MRGCLPVSQLGGTDIAEEPAALVGHGGVCEEGGRNSNTSGFPYSDAAQAAAR